MQRLQHKTIEALFLAQSASALGKLAQSASALGKLAAVYAGSKRRCFPVDIWIATNVDKKVIEIKQVAQVCRFIRQLFGSHCDFNLDSTSDHVCRLIFAIQLIDEAFYTKFVIDSNSHTEIAQRCILLIHRDLLYLFVLVFIHHSILIFTAVYL